MSKQDKLRNHRVYFPISKTAGITQEYLNENHEKYIKGELTEGIDYIEQR